MLVENQDVPVHKPSKMLGVLWRIGECFLYQQFQRLAVSDVTCTYRNRSWESCSDIYSCWQKYVLRSAALVGTMVAVRLSSRSLCVHGVNFALCSKTCCFRLPMEIWTRGWREAEKQERMRIHRKTWLTRTCHQTAFTAKYLLPWQHHMHPSHVPPYFM